MNNPVFNLKSIGEKGPAIFERNEFDLFLSWSKSSLS